MKKLFVFHTFAHTQSRHPVNRPLVVVIAAHARIIILFPYKSLSTCAGTGPHRHRHRHHNRIAADADTYCPSICSTINQSFRASDARVRRLSEEGQLSAQAVLHSLLVAGHADVQTSHDRPHPQSNLWRNNSASVRDRRPRPHHKS